MLDAASTEKRVWKLSASPRFIFPLLKAHPATTPYVSADTDPHYPLVWTEIMFDVLNPLCQTYAKEGYVMTTVPMVYVHNHR